MEFHCFEAILLVTSVLFCLCLVTRADSRTLCIFGQNDCEDKQSSCLNINSQDFKNTDIHEGIKHIRFQRDVDCSPSIKGLLRLARKRGITIEGACSVSSECSPGRQICKLSEDSLCGQHHSRRRRNVVADPEIKEKITTPTGPGGTPVLPCDFESGFCQLFQLSDSDFKWTRNKGRTQSSSTGPSSDHTTGNGYYIYIETSLPRKINDKARLVSPTLRPVQANQTCNLTFYLHMYGDSIGHLNIYQAPVVGHDVVKKRFTSSQGNAWIREEVIFDSEREFQIIIEGVRGVSYRGDIAIDDVSFSSGCQRLEPAHVRLDLQNSVEVYHNGTWGQVCSSGWTGNDSDVACKELGYKSFNRSFGSPMDELNIVGYESISCSGSEKSFDNCTKIGWSNTTTCSNNQTASLYCTGIAPVCPLKTHFYCPKKANETKGKCISHSQRCDFINDCWDGSDETNCDNYTRCTFESDYCGWIQARNDHLNWTRHRGSTPSFLTGPNADHTGSKDKYYIFVEVSGRAQADKGRIVVGQRFRGNHEGQCKVRFFYHMYGWSTGRLRVLVNDIYFTHKILEKVGSHGNQWLRAEVTLINTTRSFQVMFEAEHSGMYHYGDIAIDDVSFTPECRPTAIENITCSEGTFKCKSGECIPLEDRCDFNVNCLDGFDEMSCGNQPGRCNFEGGFCDWRNETDDVFDFERHSGRTLSHGTGPSYDHTYGYGKNGNYLYIEASLPRRFGHNARLAGPQFMWTGIKGCQMRFFYHMWSSRNYYYVGTLKAVLRNVITRENRTLWKRTGSQGNRWLQADVPITTDWSVAQIVLEASVGNSFEGDIAIDDVSFSPQCYPDTPAHVEKNYDVRLVGYKSSFQGRVEIFRVGYWGTICKDGWDRNDAQVVCRQLGYGGAVDTSIRTVPGKGQIWLDNLKCFGNESNLNMCGHKGWSVHNCDHSKDATAVCDISSGSTVPLRLAGYNRDHTRGVVEVYYQGVWGEVCYDDWDLHDAHVACRQAGFLGIERITKENSTRSTNHIWLSEVNCSGSEDSLGKCRHSGWGAVSKCRYGYAGVVCKMQSSSEGVIRLVGGGSFKEGRVEVFHRGEWGTVCEEKWDFNDAQVVCFELGFTGVVSYHQSFGPGTGRIWLHNVQCSGTEHSLTSCPSNSWGNNPCDHSEDVGVICGDQAYVGCYKDGQPRVMPHKMSMTDLTPVKCLKYCRGLGYDYLGLEWSTECYCGNYYNKHGNASEKDCASPCTGDHSKTCGGPWRLSVYSTNQAIVPSSAPGWLPVRQSCSSVSYWSNFVILTPISSPNYFSGDHNTGYIWSPGWPNDYPNKIHCVWVLNLHPGSKAKITFLSFNLEEDYDIFEARDGKRLYSQRLTPNHGFTGTNASPLTASTNIMWLKFYADETIAKKGFKLQYFASGLASLTTPGPTTPLVTTIDPNSLSSIQRVVGGCNGKLHVVNVTFGYYDNDHSTGYVKSPGYPASYGRNQKCNWTVVVQNGFRISVRIEKITVESPGDVFAIDDGKTTQTSRDHSPPWGFKSADQFLRVSFTSGTNSRRKRNVPSFGFFMKYEREKIDADGKADKNKGGDTSLSGGSIAGIVIAFIVLSVIIIILVLLLIKNVKKRNNPTGRHFFINQAYDNTEGMASTNPAIGPTPPSGLQDASIFYANTAVAPPPYTPQADSTDPVPGYAVPTTQENRYANLYSQPPPYQQNSNVTTTGIGSVTNLRNANDSSRPTSATTIKPATVLTPVEGMAAGDTGNPFGVKSVLPPISIAASEEKKPLTDEQAGPLPQKMPIDVATTDNNNHPTPITRGPLEGHVTRSQASTDYDVEVPFEFICPISNNIMKHPVSASDGYTYERRAIKSWFRRNQTSPMTNERMTDLSLRPNEHLETRIKEFVLAHKV